MSTKDLIALASTDIRVFDLAQPLQNGVPQSGDHPPFRMSVTRRHGDIVRKDGSTGSTEIVFTSGHVGTHIDALSHVSYADRFFGGVPVSEAMDGGRYVRFGAEEIPILLCQGVLLDIPAVLGRERLDGDEQVLPEHLDAALDRAGVEPQPGGVILIRTGWGQLFGDRQAFEGETTGTPGIGADGADWVAKRKPRAVGGETIPFEWFAPLSNPRGMHVHKKLIVDEGIHIMEVMRLDELAAAGVAEFLFVLAPLPLVGATGSPARPFAVVKPD